MTEEELIRELTYFRAVNKISKTKLAKMLKISVNSLNKILRKEHVKDTTRIYIIEKFKKIKEEGVK